MVLSNPRLPDNPLEVVNPIFCALTGYAERDIVGRNCRFLTGAGTDPAATKQIRAGIRAHSRSSSTSSITGRRQRLSQWRDDHADLRRGR